MINPVKYTENNSYQIIKILCEIKYLLVPSGFPVKFCGICNCKKEQGIHRITKKLFFSTKKSIFNPTCYTVFFDYNIFSAFPFVWISNQPANTNSNNKKSRVSKQRLPLAEFTSFHLFFCWFHMRKTLPAYKPTYNIHQFPNYLYAIVVVWKISALITSTNNS